MTFYAHLSILSAIIAGLAIVKLLNGLVWMARGRQRIKVYWVHLLWVVTAIFIQFNHYWVIGNLRNNVEGESWRGYADMLWAPIFAYLFAALLIPKDDKDGQVDLQEFYYANRTWIFGAAAGMAMLNAGFIGEFINHPFALVTVFERYVPVLAIVALAATGNKWLHMAMPIIVLLWMALGISN